MALRSMLVPALDSVACRAFTDSAWPIDRRVAWLQVGADGLDAVNADRKATVATPTAAGPDGAVAVAAGTGTAKIRTKKRKPVRLHSKGSGAPSNGPTVRPCVSTQTTPFRVQSIHYQYSRNPLRVHDYPL